MPRLKLYTRSYCPYCDQAKAILAAAGIDDYDEISIDGNEFKMRKDLFKMTGGRGDVPQAFIDDSYIGDDDDLARLHQSGELQSALS